MQEIVQSLPLPIPVSWDLEAKDIYLDNDRGIVARGPLDVHCEPPAIDGVVQIELGQPFILRLVPAGSIVCVGPRPVAEFGSIDDFAITFDLPGDYQISIDSPLHVLSSIVLRVVQTPTDDGAGADE